MILEEYKNLRTPKILFWNQYEKSVANREYFEPQT
jgi:hypothetical protein